MQQQRITSHRKMSTIEHAFHISMCLFTMGLWGFVYASRLRSRTTVMTIAAAAPAAPLQYPPPPCTRCGAPFAVHYGGMCPPVAPVTGR